MDDTFDSFEHAAVAGAEGTAWPMPDFQLASFFDPFPATDDCEMQTQIHQYDHVQPPPVAHMNPASHVPSPSVPIPMLSFKNEPDDAPIISAPSSPSQPSNSSLDSAQSHIHSILSQPFSTQQNLPNISTLSTSPTSTSSLKTSSLPTTAKASTSDKSLVPNGASSRTLMKSSTLATSPTTTSSILGLMDLHDLAGTTAARSRKMSEEERKIMLHKRRLRNRASAARSREKRSKTLNDLAVEVGDLIQTAILIAQQASQVEEEARELRAKNIVLSKENRLLKAGRKS